MKKIIMFVALCFVPVAGCLAGQFTAAGIALDVPDRFEGPVSRANGPAVVYGFSRPSSTPRVRTLLQISAYDLGVKVPKLSKEEMWQGTDRYLLQFLTGVERRRSDFSKGKLTHVSLGGAPASKISWRGIYQGRKANGVMYCLIVGDKVVSLHTQDAGDGITPNMHEALQAIDGLTVTQKN